MSAEQNIDERVYAAGCVAQTHWQVVAGVICQRGTRYAQVYKLQHVVGPNTDQEHSHKNQNHFSEADDTLSRQACAIPEKKCVQIDNIWQF